MRRALFLTLCAALLGGCASRSRPESTARSSVQPSAFAPVGRILTVDLQRMTAVVTLSPLAPPPAGGFDQRELLARTDDLRPTARLQGTSYLHGRTLGVRILAGRANPGDEVVFAPLNPQPAPAPPDVARPPAPAVP